MSFTIANESYYSEGKYITKERGFEQGMEYRAVIYSGYEIIKREKFKFNTLTVKMRDCIVVAEKVTERYTLFSVKDVSEEKTVSISGKFLYRYKVLVAHEEFRDIYGKVYDGFLRCAYRDRGYLVYTDVECESETLASVWKALTSLGTLNRKILIVFKNEEVKTVREVVVKIVNTGINTYIELPEKIPQFSDGERLEYREAQDGTAVIVKYPFKD